MCVMAAYWQCTASVRNQHVACSVPEEGEGSNIHQGDRQGEEGAGLLPSRDRQGEEAEGDSGQDKIGTPAPP